jgi:hypothetical protein
MIVVRISRLASEQRSYDCSQRKAVSQREKLLHRLILLCAKPRSLTWDRANMDQLIKAYYPKQIPHPITIKTFILEALLPGGLCPASLVRRDIQVQDFKQRLNETVKHFAKQVTYNPGSARTKRQLQSFLLASIMVVEDLSKRLGLNQFDNASFIRETGLMINPSVFNTILNLEAASSAIFDPLSSDFLLPVRIDHKPWDFAASLSALLPARFLARATENDSAFSVKHISNVVQGLPSYLFNVMSIDEPVQTQPVSDWQGTRVMNRAFFDRAPDRSFAQDSRSQVWQGLADYLFGSSVLPDEFDKRSSSLFVFIAKALDDPLNLFCWDEVAPDQRNHVNAKVNSAYQAYCRHHSLDLSSIHLEDVELFDIAKILAADFKQSLENRESQLLVN